MQGNQISTAVGGKVRRAQIYIFSGGLAKLHTVELGTSWLKGDGTNRNPLTVTLKQTNHKNSYSKALMNRRCQSFTLRLQL